MIRDTRMIEESHSGSSGAYSNNDESGSISVQPYADHADYICDQQGVCYSHQKTICNPAVCANLYPPL